MKYAYTAIISPEENGAYSVRFPDLPGCVTVGSDLPDALNMAHDVLCLWLYDMEQDDKTIPPAVSPNLVKALGSDFTSIVAIDTEDYRRFYENKTVKKTLTIPMWLHEKAVSANIDYSQTLQKAIKAELHISD